MKRFLASALTSAALILSVSAQNPLLQFNDQMVEITESSTPAVVTVLTEKIFTYQYRDPFEDFFNWGRSEPRESKYTQPGMGSGVIVTGDGYILTNNHVVNGVSKVTVKTIDGLDYSARVIGVDPRTDIAVIKVDGANFKPIRLGNSDNVRVGELVLAIGCPLEEKLNHTVTMGIVSAKGRSNMGLAAFEDFIQTDAAINPGNSGGALINMKGELVGINTAIVSQTGGYQGIGFSIPVNMARNVMESLINYGKVVRGYSGIYLSNLNESQAKQAGITTKAGLMVTEVDPESPGAAAGILAGDVITRMNGKETGDAIQFRSRIATLPPGTSIVLEVLRSGKNETLKFDLGELPQPGASNSLSGSSKHFLGFLAEHITPELTQKFHLPEYDGLVITEVIENTGAARAGLKSGDVLLQADGKGVKTQEELLSILRGKKEGESIRVRIWRQGFYHNLAVELG